MFTLVSVGTAFCLLALSRRVVSPVALIVASLAPVLLGLEQFASHRQWPAEAWVVFAAPAAFCLGSVLARSPKPDAAERAPSDDQIHQGAAVLSLAVLAMLSVAHFAIVGIPLLSGNIEVARFTLDSGFLGLPSRAVLFAIPICVLVICTNSDTYGGRIVAASWTLFVGTRLLMGFKSSLLEVLVIALLVVMIRGGGLTVKRAVGLGIAFVSSVIYVNWVGSQYSTIARSGGISVEYVLDRLGRQAAEPIWHALTLREWATYQSFAVNDLHYFASRYFGIGASGGFPVDQIVSSHVTGTPLQHSEFLVPVTIGGPAYLLGATPLGGMAGAAAALVLVMLLGTAFQRSCARLSQSVDGRLGSCVGAAAFIVCSRVFMLNGGGVYIVINGLLSYLMVLAPMACWIFVVGGGRRRRNGTAVPKNRGLVSETLRG